jgi:hypothetical protein
MAATPQAKIQPQPRQDLPSNFQDLMTEVNRSRRMLEWDDNWDGDGSPAYDEATLARAADFLMRSSIALWADFRLNSPVPEIAPGPDGSLDLDWQTANRELLVNIPADLDKPATFYGDDKVNTKLKGILDTSADNVWLLMWLTR